MMECGKRQVAVIGGGASGLAAAVAAARCGAETTLYEAMTRPGRKLLITGNGRCNLCNKRAGDGGVYAGMNGTDAAELAASVFARFSADKICAFFEEIGVAVRAEGDLLYPRSGQASTVLAALLKEAERLHVKLKYNTRIRSLRRDESSGRWEIGTDGWTYTADAVVLASGSKAAPETGSDGSGYALAEECALRGAKVTLVSGPVSITTHNNNIRVIPVMSAKEMYDQCVDLFGGMDIGILAAAVADFTPLQKSAQKIKRKGMDYELKLTSTRDIAAALGRAKKPEQKLIGFALETENEMTNAQQKLQDKNFDFIVLNSLQDKGAGFSVDTNKITIISKASNEKFPLKSKKAVAKDIVDRISML